MFENPHPQPVSTFGSLHLQGSLWIGVGCWSCCGKCSYKTSAGLSASQSSPWVGFTHSAASWGIALNVLFTACLFLHSVCTLCNFPSFPPAPCGPWSEWPLIHTDCLEISLNPTCLGRKASKRSHVCSVPDSWALREHTGRRSPTPEKPILVQEPAPLRSKGCRRRHQVDTPCSWLCTSPHADSHVCHQWQRILQPLLCFGTTFVNCFSSSV